MKSAAVNCGAIPGTLNLVLCVLLLMVIFFQMFAMPFLLAGHPVIMALIIVIMIPLNTPLWSLIHEGIHRNLHADKTLNENVSRALCICFGASFHILRFGHFMHHQYNREWESEFSAPGASRWRKWCAHYFKILGGLYLTEVFMTFLVAITPLKLMNKISYRIFPDEQHLRAVTNMLAKTDNIRKVRIDFALIVALYTAAFIAFGAHALLFALMVAGRAVIISLMDNAYHYGTPPDNSVPAKELQAPRWYSKFILNFNHHLTHHDNAGLSWIYLGDHHKAQNMTYSENIFAALFRQFRGPLLIE